MSWNTTTDPDPSIQDWSAAYKELCDLIATKVPEVKHVDLYYGQENLVDGDGNWMPFRAPAVFLEFNTAQVDDLGQLGQQLLMDITVYLYMETVQDTNAGSAGQRRALEFTGLLRKLHQVLHGTGGEHYGPLGRTALRRVEAPPYVYLYAQTFQCVIMDYAAVRQWPQEDMPPFTVERLP